MCCKNLTAAAAIGAVLLLAGLSCEKAAVTPQGTATLEIYLSDAPSPYQAIWIDIEKIMVTVSSDTPTDSGWTEIPMTRTGVYNLESLTHGLDTLIATQRLPEGSVSEMRLVLGGNNYLVGKDGALSPLSLSSPLADGLEIPVQAELHATSTTRLVLDIDGAASVLSTPAGYVLSPKIRSYEKGTTGGIQGVVLPDSVLMEVRVFSATDSARTVPDSSGYFQISGLGPGTYQVIFGAEPVSGYRNDTLESVSVRPGQLTRLDTVRLVQDSTHVQ